VLPTAAPAADTAESRGDVPLGRRDARQPDSTLLFRYSALTHNGHRIHYDRPYAVEVEGYPGLVVHGPLIATLLLDLLRRNRPDADIARFAFRAVSPLFDTAPFKVCGRTDADGKTIKLWARNDGALAMDATAVLR
jgi:3-methylfumaryl-CoA hydratase